MPQPCTVCSHPARAVIDRLLLDGTDANRRIASNYGLSEAAIRRHKESHLPLRLMKAQEAAEQLEADSLLERLRLLNRESLEVLQAAKKSKKHDLTLKAIARLERQIELEARLIGQLAAVQVNVNLVSSPEWVAVRTVILRALEPHPEARRDVLQALGGHHEFAG